MHPSSITHDNKRVAAELLAYAVLQLFPNVTLVGGGVNKLGFFYDFIFSQPLPPDASSLIEVELRKVLKEDHPIRFANMMRENTENFFLHHSQPFLADRARNEASNILELLQIRSFSGLCPSCDIQSTIEVAPCIKILDLQEKEIQFQEDSYGVIRFIGNCFTDQQELKKFSKQYERHRKKAGHLELGKELNLFIQNSESNEIETIWMPKGEHLRLILQDWVKPYFTSRNVQFVSTPTLIKKSKNKLPEDSLRLNFKDQIYWLVSSRLQAHSEILQTQWKAKQALPIGVAEYGLSYKIQSDGDLDGVLSSHSIFADQMTLCCKREGAIKEIISFLLFIEQIIKIFSFEARWYLVTSLGKGSKAKTEAEAVEKLIEAAQHCEFPFQTEKIEEEGIEGPRLELRIVDKLQREWPCSTLTIVVHEIKILDFFKNQVKDKENLSEVPLLMTQSLWGSLDRFIALLIEHYEGHLPIWLAPEQIRILVISKSAQSFAKHVLETCLEKGLRITADVRDIKLSEKVHDTGKEKIPLNVVIGENESNKKYLTVQDVHRSGKSQVLTLDRFLDKELLEIKCPVLK